MSSAIDTERKTQRRLFADCAARRIAVKMHESLRLGQPVTTDTWRKWWDEEGKVAKAGGLYSFSTYYHDAATGLMHMAEERGWGRFEVLP